MLNPFEYVLENNIIDLTKYLENNEYEKITQLAKELVEVVSE